MRDWLDSGYGWAHRERVIMEHSQYPTLKTRVVAFLETQPKAWLWMEAIALSLVVGFIDYATGYEVSMGLFYSVPILFMVWFNNRISGVFMALLCTIIWWWADQAAGHLYVVSWHQIWETLMILGYFLLFVEVATAMKARIALLEHSRQLEQEIIRISEREQRRIGQDWHDGLCQYYAAIGCAAGSLKHNLEKLRSPAAKSAAEIEELIMKGVGQARSLARGLAPVENEARGLQFALEDLTHVSARLLGIECRMICEGPVSIFDNTRANHLYRIAQEAISNASRHGKATVVNVRLSSAEALITLAIEDNGSGFPQPVPESRGMGLNIMQYRARMIGGQLVIAPRPSGGTIVACSFQQQTPNLPSS